MYPTPNLARWLYLFILALIAVPGFADDSQGGEPPDVRAVLFYLPQSSQSKDLFAFYLPALYERYGTRLEISGIDLSQPAGRRAYGAAAEHMDLPARPGDGPIVLVGDRVAVGLMAIAATLGDDFEDLAKDPSARNWPVSSALEGLLPAGVKDIKARLGASGSLSIGDLSTQSTSGEAQEGDRIGIGLAVLVLVGMVAALIVSLVKLWRENTVARPSRPWVLAIPLLAGLAISGYTAYTALADVALMCGPIGSCSEVQNSEYAKPFGIPMGVVGLVGYSAILVTWLMAAYLSPRGGGWYWLPWAVSLFGVLFSLRLTALESFVIGAACLWCLGSAVSITVVFWLLTEHIGTGARSP